MGNDALFHASDIDLNECYENRNGDLVPGRNFYYSACDVSIEPSAQSLLLKAKLKGNHWYSGDFWNLSETDLVTCIVVRDGHFVFEEQ